MTGFRTAPRAALLLFCGVLAWSSPRADATQDATDFVRERGGSLLDILKHAPGPQRRREFKDWLDLNFDLEGLARGALGPFIQRVTPPQLAAYRRAFDDYIVVTYEARFEALDRDSFRIGLARPIGNGDVVVRTTFANVAGISFTIDYRVRPWDNGFKVVDVAVERLSMLKTHRDEFIAVIQRRGMDGLIESLRQRAAARARSDP